MIPLDETARFQEQLYETGAYRTDPDRPLPAADRWFGRFDAWYYLGVVRSIYTGYLVASRGEFDHRQWAAHSLACLRTTEACGGDIEITGLENVYRLDRPPVVIGNPMSMIEAFTMPVLLNRTNNYVAVVKESLTTMPGFGAIMRAVDPISVRRENPREDLKTVLSQGQAYLKAGRTVVVFPQSTRSAVFDPKAFNSLGVKLAKKAGAPVIPLAVKTDFQQNGSLIKDLGALDRTKKIHLRFGAPIHVSGSGKAAQEQVVAFIAGCLKEWA